jgi:protein-S-isoprenylcysteine O-methyltransferase Ste14
MRTETVEKWVWILIYAGLFAVAVGLAVRGASGWLTSLLVAVGAVAVVAGGVLIWWRSRMTGHAAQPPSRPDEPA